jgi:DNA-binding response OmpR family regulator
MAKKVLIIEDRRENIVFIANNILRPEGWEVITARDGELGLQKAVEEKPDLIITDLKLPRMHGLDMLEELNKKGYRIPTIVMTFHGSEETAIRAFRLGAADYLIKPFEVDDMMNAIERALGRGAAGQASSAGADPAGAEKLAGQEREIQRLKSLLQEQERAAQERQKVALPPQADPGEAIRWQALLRERDATLANLKKQTIAQHRAMTQQINELQARLAEKEGIVTQLQSQRGDTPSGREAGSDSQAQRHNGDLSNQLMEKEKALVQANKLVETLTQTVAVHQQAIGKHREEAERLARELHMLAAAIQVLGQGLGDQVQQISNILPGEK